MAFLGQDNPPALSGPCRQCRQAAQEVTPVRSPSLGQGVAVGQQQRNHHGSRASSDQWSQGLSGEHYGQEGGKWGLRGDEQGSAGGTNGVDGNVAGGAADREVHHSHRCYPRDYCTRHAPECGLFDYQRRKQDAGGSHSQGDSYGGDRVDPGHAGAAGHRGSRESDGPQQRKGNGDHDQPA